VCLSPSKGQLERAAVHVSLTCIQDLRGNLVKDRVRPCQECCLGHGRRGDGHELEAVVLGRELGGRVVLGDYKQVALLDLRVSRVLPPGARDVDPPLALRREEVKTI
jgi:hypothetical protein